MQVFQDTVAGIIANGILPRTASIVYAMYQMMRQKKRDCTRYSRFINRIQQRFKIKLRHGTPRFHHTFQYEKSDSRRLDVSFCQLIQINLFFHILLFYHFLYPYGIHDSNQCYTNIGENSFPKCSQSTGSQNQYQQFHTKRQ